VRWAGRDRTPSTFVTVEDVVVTQIILGHHDIVREV
jgi:hypothetical protein